LLSTLSARPSGEGSRDAAALEAALSGRSDERAVSRANWAGSMLAWRERGAPPPLLGRMWSSSVSSASDAEALPAPSVSE